MLKIPLVEGPRLEITPCAPHKQISHSPDSGSCRAFRDRAFDFPFVAHQPSMISVPGAETPCLGDGHGSGCRELLTYIEHRDRQFFTLFSRRAVRIAKNLTIIATFNPIDRSAIDI